MCAKRDKKPGFDSEFDGVALKIRLRGEIDHHAAAVVRINMDELIRSRTPRVLAIDMSAVDFMDSSGLGLIMGRYSLMQSMGGETVILDPSPATERIMSLAGMERMIKIQRTKMVGAEIVPPKKRGACKRRLGVVSKTPSGAVSVNKQENDKRGEAK